MQIEQKLKQIETIIELAKKRTSNINKEDIKEVEKYYQWPDGTIFTAKMIEDFKMWKCFESDYCINKIGISKLRDILGDPQNFKEKYNIK